MSAGPSIGQANRMPMYCTTADSPEATVGARHLLESLLSADQEEDAIAQNYQPKISPISHNISLWSEGVRADYTVPRSGGALYAKLTLYPHQKLMGVSNDKIWMFRHTEMTFCVSSENVRVLEALTAIRKHCVEKIQKKTRKQW